MSDPWTILDEADARLAEAAEAVDLATRVRREANSARNEAVRAALSDAGVVMESTDPYPSKRLLSADRKAHWGSFPSEKHALAFVRYSLRHLREAPDA